MYNENLQDDLGENSFVFLKSKEGRSFLINKFIKDKNIIKSEKPLSWFMAGSPGAGKTEISRNFINQRIKEGKNNLVIIDADEIREVCKGYNGKNSSTFQKSSDKGINILLDYCLDNDLDFLLDATFAYKNYKENIKRCIKKNRKIVITYVYQDPISAWNLTKAREIEKGRVVPKGVFIDSFFESRKNVMNVLREFEDKIFIYFVYKKYKNNEYKMWKINTEDEFHTLNKKLDKDKYNIEILTSILN